MTNGNPALTSMLLRERERELARDGEISRQLRDHRYATEGSQPAPAAPPQPRPSGLRRLTRRALTGGA